MGQDMNVRNILKTRASGTMVVCKKRYEPESVYASESHFGWSRKVFQHHPLATYGLRRPSENIQNLILMHELIRIRDFSESTYGNTLKAFISLKC